MALWVPRPVSVFWQAELQFGRQRRPAIRLFVPGREFDPQRQEFLLIVNGPTGQQFDLWRLECINCDRQQFDPGPLAASLIRSPTIQFDHWRQKFTLVASGPTIQQFDSIRGKSSFSSQPTVTIHSVLGRPWIANNSIINHCRQKFGLLANNSIIGSNRQHLDPWRKFSFCPPALRSLAEVIKFVPWPQKRHLDRQHFNSMIRSLSLAARFYLGPAIDFRISGCRRLSGWPSHCLPDFLSPAMISWGPAKPSL